MKHYLRPGDVVLEAGRSATVLENDEKGVTLEEGYPPLFIQDEYGQNHQIHQDAKGAYWEDWR